MGDRLTIDKQSLHVVEYWTSKLLSVGLSLVGALQILCARGAFTWQDCDMVLALGMRWMCI